MAKPEVRSITINFEGVESGGFASIHVPEGDYALEVKKVNKRVGKESGSDYLLFMLKITAGNQKGVGKTLPHTCSLTKNSLWNLRNLLEAAGKTIPAKAIKIDLDKLAGLKMGASLVDDEYEGKIKSTVGAFFPLSELNLDGNKAPAGKASSKKEEEEEEEESETSDMEAEEEEGEELFDE